MLLRPTANFRFSAVRPLQQIRSMLVHQLNLASLLWRNVSAHAILILQLSPD
jgi:hypothetical protein